jgi:hypothetical protein
MRPIFRVLTALLVIATVPAIGAAQELPDELNNSTSSTPTPTPEPETTTVQVSPNVAIVDYQLDGETLVITLRVQQYSTITVTDAAALSEAASSGGRGSESIPARLYELERGRHTVRFAATVVQGETAATVADGTDIELIRTGRVGGGRFLARLPPWQSWVGGTVLGVGWFLAGGTWAWYRTKDWVKVADA